MKKYLFGDMKMDNEIEMKVDYEEKNKIIEHGINTPELESGVYSVTCSGKDRILLVKGNIIFLINDWGEIEEITNSDLDIMYKNIRRIKKLKIEFEV